MSRKVLVAGVGMTRFRRPSEGAKFVELGSEALRAALEDAGMGYADIEQAYVGYCYGDSTCGQRVMYEVGMSGIPIINVNNNCSTGSTALFLARQAVASGAVECAIAVGFEEMGAGELTAKWSDRQQPLEAHVRVTKANTGEERAPWAARMFGGAGREYAQRYGLAPETLAMISVKARKHASCNGRAVFRAPITIEEVLKSPTIFNPLTKLQCCPPTSGGAAAIVCSQEFAQRRGLPVSVSIAGQAMTTDYPDAFGGSMIKMAGLDMTRGAVDLVYEQSGLGPDDLDVIELHDCFTANELITYEGLGLTPDGTAERFVHDGQNTYGGRYVTNPSGGLLSKGHPLGATGLAQCAELVWQLRGQAGPRQVEGARIGLQHNLGLGGACVVTMYRAE